MARTLDDIVQEYVDYIEQQCELANEPTRPLEGEELKRVLAEWDQKFKEMYPNGIHTPEVEQAADRWEETQNVAEGVLELLVQRDQKDAKIEELQDTVERERVEKNQYRELSKYLGDLVSDLLRD